MLISVKKFAIVLSSELNQILELIIVNSDEIIKIPFS